MAGFRRRGEVMQVSRLWCFSAVVRHAAVTAIVRGGFVLVVGTVATAGGGVRAEDAEPPRGATVESVEVSDAATEPTSPQDFMAARGFVRYRGMWRTVQEIELIERAERANLARKDWSTRLDRLRKRLEDPRQTDDAGEEIREIADPSAVPALAAAVAAERSPRVRAFYVEALSRVRSAEAGATLVAVAVDHADPETRILAVEKLAVIGAEAASVAILPALGGADNGRINRAAEALGRLGSAGAVGPLIEALETEHVVTVGGGPPEGSTTATFTPSGGGLSMGGGPKRQKLRARNQQVLEALVRLTGANFEWDVQAWRSWAAGRQAPPEFDLRRG